VANLLVNEILSHLAQSHGPSPTTPASPGRLPRVADAVSQEAFGDQAIPLAMQPAVIFFFNAGDTDNAPYLRIAAQICQQRAQQLWHVDIVCLYPSRATIDMHTR
jgi:hypothetical protein